MPIRIVQSKQNARLKELRKALTHPGRNERGLVGIEGPNLVFEAISSGLRVDAVFAASQRIADDIASQQNMAHVDVFLALGDSLRSALITESPQSLAALVEPPEWKWNDLLHRPGSEALIILLAGIQDPGNLGTIVRSAEAFQATGVICLPGTVNPWNSKAVRASAGSIFRVPLLQSSETEALDQLHQAAIPIFTTAVEGAQPATLASLTGPVALVIGNEGNGVPDELAAHTDGALTIPCPGPVESLNAAVAASVLLYEASRQRGSSKQSEPARPRRSGAGDSR
ncbi:TrmH family RNA methyltransferase [Occallatibacter savannae]|uniref:TrmH family RNA methyltransferase n=1 Tax=Occallatibacter savannae TaxID=1002691 RepID=UPI000D696703|nr:RNA methyltransferase [Occallatibacter savannae]